MADLSKLSDRELDERCAELIGWRRLTSDEREYWNLSMSLSWWADPKGLIHIDPMACSSDLNAAHELEDEIEQRGQIGWYTLLLGRIVARDGEGNQTWGMIHATARQRSEAFALTMERVNG